MKRSANGIIIDPVTLPPDATVAPRDETDGAVKRVRRADREGRPAGGHSHAPRPAVPGDITTCRSAK